MLKKIFATGLLVSMLAAALPVAAQAHWHHHWHHWHHHHHHH
ncbi:MAG TPA: hypothetical protein VGG12_07765 [Methylovirgula sp.]